MATTATITRLQIPAAVRAGKKEALVTVNWDTYATGGFSLDPTTNKLGTRIHAAPVVGFAGASTWDFAFDLANNKLMAFVRSTGVEVANGASLATVDTTLHVVYS